MNFTFYKIEVFHRTFNTTATSKSMTEIKSGTSASFLTFTHDSFELETSIKNFSLISDNDRNKIKKSNAKIRDKSNTWLADENFIAPGASHTKAITTLGHFEMCEKKF